MHSRIHSRIHSFIHSHTNALGVMVATTRSSTAEQRRANRPIASTTRTSSHRIVLVLVRRRVAIHINLSLSSRRVIVRQRIRAARHATHDGEEIGAFLRIASSRPTERMTQIEGVVVRRWRRRRTRALRARHHPCDRRRRRRRRRRHRCVRWNDAHTCG